MHLNNVWGIETLDMDRIVLLVLWGIPIPVIFHVAIFSRPTTPAAAMTLSSYPGLIHGPASESMRFFTKPASEQGQ
jgi:hypothetical protein